MVVSNELPDVFPVHCLHLENEQLLVQTVIPTIDPKDLSDLSRSLKDELLKMDKILKKTLFKDGRFGNSIVVSTQLLNALPKNIVEKLQWNEIFVPPQYFPEVMDFLEQQGADYFITRSTSKRRYINTGLKGFVNSLVDVIEKGYVLTVDYGSSNMDAPDDNLRVFGSKKLHISKNSSPLNNFGKIDITASLNFTALNNYANANGFSPQGYTTESSLCYQSLSPSHPFISCHSWLFHSLDKSYKAFLLRAPGTKSNYLLPVSSQPLTYFEEFRARFGAPPSLKADLHDLVRKSFAHFSPASMDQMTYDKSFHAFMIGYFPGISRSDLLPNRLSCNKEGCVPVPKNSVVVSHSPATCSSPGEGAEDEIKQLTLRLDGLCIKD